MQSFYNSITILARRLDSLDSMHLAHFSGHTRISEEERESSGHPRFANCRLILWPPINSIRENFAAEAGDDEAEAAVSRFKATINHLHYLANSTKTFCDLSGQSHAVIQSFVKHLYARMEKLYYLDLSTSSSDKERHQLWLRMSVRRFGKYRREDTAVDRARRAGLTLEERREEDAMTAERVSLRAIGVLQVGAGELGRRMDTRDPILRYINHSLAPTYKGQSPAGKAQFKKWHGIYQAGGEDALVQELTPLIDEADCIKLPKKYLPSWIPAVRSRQINKYGNVDP